MDKEVAFLKEHLAATWGFLTDLFIEKAEGLYLYDRHGNRYADFTSGHAVTNIGHNHPKVVEAIKAQAERIIHSGSTFYYDSIYQLVKRLVDITPPGMDRFFFANSGAEAVEGAIKLARYHTRRQGIISFTGAFHGRTLGTVSLTSSSVKYRTYYHPLLPSVYHSTYPYCNRCTSSRTAETCELDCLLDLERLFAQEIAPNDVAAVIIEPVLGEGGYVPAPAIFLERLREICTDNGILLIFDEVQSGMGRTAKWLALDHYRVKPDIITVAKGIASGLPLSAIISTAEIMDGWEKGAHGTTLGGNPVSCAAAAATIDAIKEESLLESSELISGGVFERLSALKDETGRIGDVRGLGYMIGIEFNMKGCEPDAEAVEKVKEYCLKNRLLVFEAGTYKNIIRLCPPLITTPEQMDEALAIFEDAVRKL